MLDTQTRAVDTGMVGKELFEKGGLTDEGQVQRGEFNQRSDAGRNNAVGTEVPTHCIDRDDRSGQGLLVCALVDHFAATVDAFRRNVVAQVNFTGGFFNRQGISREGIVGTTHVTGRAGFFVLLNSHNQLTPKRLGHALTVPIH
ncbi:hypothetical protein D9M69_291930 [compost metagenome]